MSLLTNITMDIKQNMTLAEKLESDGWVYYPNIESLMKPWLTDANFVPTVTVYAVTFVLGLIGNSMVVFAMLGDQKNSSVATTFLASLAIADLLFLLVCVPYRIVRFLIGSWQDSFLCKFSGFVEMLAAVLSIFNLTAVSVERYVVIVHPMKARYLFTMGSIKKIVIAVWLVSAVLSAPMFHIAGITKDKYFENETKFIMHSCHDNEALNYGEKVAFVFYQFTLMFLLPTIVMVFCYTQVIRALWSSTQELSRMTSMHRENSISHIAEDFESGESQTQQRLVHVSSRSTVVSRPSSQQLGGRNHGNCIREARKQVIKMLIVIIIAFLICWGPKLILDILIKTRINRKIIFSPITFKIKVAFSLLPYIQSCLNPIIYGFMSSNFRRSLVNSCNTYLHLCQRRKGRTYFDPDTDSKSTQHTRLSPSFHRGGSHNGSSGGVEQLPLTPKKSPSEGNGRGSFHMYKGSNGLRKD